MGDKTNIEKPHTRKYKNIFVNRTWLEDENISAKELAIMIALCNVANKNDIENYISYKIISYNLYGVVKNDKREIDMIRTTFKSLVDKNIVKIIRKDSQQDFICDLTGLLFDNFQSQQYSVIRDIELHKIMNIKTQSSNYEMLKYFTFIVMMFGLSYKLDDSVKCKLCTLPLDTFSKQTMISKPTLIKYNDILEENKILFISRNNDFHQEINQTGNSRIKHISNIYSRWEDKNAVNDYTMKQHGYMYYKDKKNRINKKRGLSQKYLALCNGKEYPEDVIQLIYQYCVDKNRLLQKKYDNHIITEQQYKSQIKDMKVFEPFKSILIDENSFMDDDIWGDNENV